MNKKRSQGFSLVELMVAMVVGLIIMTGVFSLHSASRKTQIVNEAQMDMVADARTAIDMIAYDLRHAGMWGGTNKDGVIECRSADTACAASADAMPPAAGDCALGGDWYHDLAFPVFATDNTAGNPYSGTCILASEKYLAGTDILEIRYADSNPIVGGLVTGQAYLRSNFINGKLFTGTTAPLLPAYDTGPADPITNNHVFHAYAYYVSSDTDTSDGIPSLRRAALVNGPAIQNQTLIAGVADMQVQLGIDLDGVKDANGNVTIDSYVNPDAITVALDWTNVYAARVWLVMRSDKKQPGVDTSKTFNIAGTVKNFGGQDDYRYFMVSSVVNLRNLRQL